MDEEPLMTYIRQCFDKRVPLEQGLHAKAMLLFRQYMIVGGMPKVCRPTWRTTEVSRWRYGKKRYTDTLPQ